MRGKKLPLSEINTIHLDAQGQEPLYQQLYHAIREAVLTGRFSAGMRLPSSRRFAQLLAISRNTVVAAYNQLTDEGFLERQHGSGSYVTETLPDHFLKAPAQRTEVGEGQAPVIGLSDRGRRIAAFAMPELFENHLPFKPGLPDLSALPLDRWARLAGKHWRMAKPHMLGYGHVGGYPPLRRAVADYLKACRAVTCRPEQVMITAGAQQGLDLAGRLLLDEGDTAWLECPGYHGAYGAMVGAGIQATPVPVDREGMDLDAGERLAPHPKLIYVTPSHQYPTGVTMSLSRRLELLARARRWGSLIMEDDYDSEFRYDGKPLASLQGLDRDGRVIYVGTFSKILFPSLRLGYLVVPEALVDAFLAARCYQDRQPAVMQQAILADFIDSGHFLSHVRRMRAAYAHRHQVMVDLLRGPLSSWLSAEPTPAGMHLTAQAHVALDDKAVSRDAAKQNLLLRPLSAYYPEGEGSAGFVLGYAGWEEARLREAAGAMIEVLKKWTPSEETS